MSHHRLIISPIPLVSSSITGVVVTCQIGVAVVANAGQLTNDNGTVHDYDANGNREDTGYQVGLNNELEHDAKFDYVYDEDGRLLSKTVRAGLPDEGERWTFGYSDAGHLISVQHVAANSSVLMTAGYQVDAFGNRIAKVVDADGDGVGAATTLRFAYDGWNNARGGAIGNEHFDIWAEFDGGNSDALVTRYVHGDGVDEMLARVNGTTATWYLLDVQHL